MSDSTLRTAYIGVGSNLPSLAGSPLKTLLAAIERLREYVDVSAVSPLYTTRPVGFVEQPVFSNGVVSIRTTMPPSNLMQRLLQIEREFGRDRTTTVEKGPRTLDLDLLLMEDAIVASPLLTLPHPELVKRRFVLAPLADLAPELRHPVLGLTILELLRELPACGENGLDAIQVLEVTAG